MSEANARVSSCQGPRIAARRSIQGADRVTTSPDGPAIPVRPAAYIRDAYPYSYAIVADDPDTTQQRNEVLGLARDLGWPVPVVYADVGQADEPGSQFAALVEAVTAGRHDAVVVTHPGVIGHDLGQIEAFDRHCRQHGVRLCWWYGMPVFDTGALFEVISEVLRFTVTDEHLRLLRRAHVTWDDAEFGAPEINPKRPYGNSNVLADIADILDVPYSERNDEEMGPLPDAEWRFRRLHAETAIALQIALDTGEFRTGRYVRDDEWGRGLSRWRRAEA